MRGRLYPQPRERYERFRLNPYSPLYEGLAVFACAPPVAGIIPELHGPYALPGAAYCPISPIHRFFPEIGRAAFSHPRTYPHVFRWPIVPLSPYQVITVTILTFVGTDLPWKGFIGVHLGTSGDGTGIAEWRDSKCPYIGWVNIDNVSSRANNTTYPFPPNKWFTYAGIIRPGSANVYLSNWGIIDLQLISGTWPTTQRTADTLVMADIGDGSFIADAFVHLRELSLTELDAISDYGNVDLRVPGEAPLILPVRTYWPSVLPVAPSYLKRRSLGARVGTREAAL